MRRSLYVFSVLISAISVMHAENSKAPPASCSAPAYRQFDFWVGDWNVTQNGKQAGTNRIESILGGCALLEHWEGAGSRGNSLNYYDASRRVWHQTWIDNHGGPLELEGKLEGANMVLSGSTKDRASGAAVINRLTWTPRPDGMVRQHWETSSDGGTSWQTAFDGLYARK